MFIPPPDPEFIPNAKFNPSPGPEPSPGPKAFVNHKARSLSTDEYEDYVWAINFIHNLVTTGAIEKINSLMSGLRNLIDVTAAEANAYINDPIKHQSAVTSLMRYSCTYVGLCTVLSSTSIHTQKDPQS